jgi:hypothetical protein
VPAANLTRVSSQGTCAICGRTLLVGEQVHSFVSVEGRHEVCPLCAPDAVELGWLPAEQEGAEERLRAEAERKPGFFAKLFARAEREDGEGPEEIEELPPPAPDASPRATHELDTERYDVEAAWPEEGAVDPSPGRRRLTDFFTGRAPDGRAADLPAPEAPDPAPQTTPPPDPATVSAPDPATAPAPLPDPAGRGMRPRRLQPDISPASRFERAIARFNSSDAGRTAAGLSRTLGAPSVSVGDLAGTADEVRITVAWELTWYQWGVDLGDELRPVYELKKGYEVSEIDAPARQWNASAHDGRIVMVAPRRREGAAGRPVHR